MGGSDEILLPAHPDPPLKVLVDEARVAKWPTTPGYRGYMGWLKARCERIRGKDILRDPYEGSCQAVVIYMRLLDDMIAWIAEVPTQPQSAQRFGNLAFRVYIKLVQERLPAYFDDAPPHLAGQAIPLLLDSHAFGHPTRLDYGSGHELAFALSMWCAVVSGWAASEDDQDELVLRVFPKYLELTTLLQKTYRLEPAGSHGVWGLDDYSFLPYLFGSAQLLNGSLSPSDALALALSTPRTVDANPPLEDMFTLSLHRVTHFKTGARFSEHSPLLHNLSTFPNWVKPHGGLFKMYAAEVLGKRVVVQDLAVGGWCWGADMPTANDAVSTAPPESMRFRA